MEVSIEEVHKVIGELHLRNHLLVQENQSLQEQLTEAQERITFLESAQNSSDLQVSDRPPQE